MSERPRRGRRSAIDRKRATAREADGAAYREKRREIARAATAVFNRNGLRGTSLAAVADALGMSRAALYYYVPNKHALFDELVRESIELNVASAERIRAGPGSAVERIQALIVEMLRIGARDYPLFYIFIRENLTQVAAERAEWSRHVRQLSRRYEQIMVALVQEGIAAGELRAVASPRLMAYGIFGMTLWTNRWFDPATSLESADQIGRTFAELVMAGIRDQGAPRRAAGPRSTGVLTPPGREGAAAPGGPIGYNPGR
jgi:AcrR family transcriptional regulator